MTRARIFALSIIVSLLSSLVMIGTIVWQERRINHLETVIEDQQAYIDAGAHGRYQGEEK
jgi:hypothetical protein